MNTPLSIHDTNENQIAKTSQEITVERTASRISSRSPSEEPDINIELYSNGWFDGITGLNAQLPHVKDYWEGYQLGYREYCCGLLGVEIPASEIDSDRAKILMAA